MSVRSELEKKIERKNQEIAVLEVQIKEAKAHIAGLQEALRLMPKDGTPSRPQEQQLRPGSEMAKARDFLRKQGKSLYITDILVGIGKETTKQNIKSISGAMNNYAREGKIFVRTAPNTYGLIEFQSGATSEEDIDLPDDFGIDEPDGHDSDDIPR